MKEFFGFGGYAREPEGAYSWQHILFVSSLMAVMLLLSITIGLRNRKRDGAAKNRVLVVSALLIDGLEIFKLIICGFRGDNLLYDLPLFLCSIQLITIPLAAFSKGRVREAALDFVCIFGILGAVAGTYCAAQNYGSYPVLGFDNVVSGLTHSISGFCSVYILVSGLASMRKKNIVITFAIMLFFCAAAYIADVLIPYNYMFLMRGDGTPYDVFYNLVNGNGVLYPALVVGLFLLYISLFYLVFYLVKKKK